MGKAHLLPALIRVISSRPFIFIFKRGPVLTIRLCLKQGSLPLMGVRHLYWLARNAECEATGLGRVAMTSFKAPILSISVALLSQPR